MGGQWEEEETHSSQPGEAEGKQEAILRKTPHSQVAMGDRITRQATHQEVIPLGIPRAPSGWAMWRVQETVTCLIGKMLAVDSQPFSLVKNVAFHQPLQHLAPWYSVPAQRTVSHSLACHVRPCSW